MPDKFNALFEGETDKSHVFKKVKTRDGKEFEQEFVSVLGIELEVNNLGKGTQFEDADFKDFNLEDEVTKKMLLIYAKAIKLNQAPLVEGPTDIGKSKALEYLAHITNNHLLYQSFSGQTDVSELIGKYVPNTEDARLTFEKILAHKNKGSLKPETLKILEKASAGEEIRGLDENECRKIAKIEGLSFGKVEWVWQDGTVPRAMEMDGGQGCWLYFDELGAAEPQILVKLNRIFARGTKRLEITENAGREVEAGDNFRLIATTNPPSYAGREPFEKDFLRRWAYFKVPNLSQDDYLKRLDFVGHGKPGSGEAIEGKRINLDMAPEIDHLLNEIIALFAFTSQEYLDKIPKDSGEQEFRLRDFSDALRVQEYLRQLQGDDLPATLTEAIEFYYLNKIDEEKKDSSGKLVREKMEEILKTIMEQKKVREKIAAAIKKLQSPEISEAETALAKARKKIADREKKLKPKDNKAESLASAKTSGGDFLSLANEDGKETRFEMGEQIKYWSDFYREQGIDWIEMPEKITLTAEDKEELAKGAKALCPDGNFEKLKLLIIPAGLADTGGKYKKLNAQMSQGYKETWQSDNFKADGSIEGLKNKSDKLRIILVKDVQNLKDDEVYKSTLNKSADDLEQSGGIFEQTGLRGIDVATYLVWQREYFERTKKHLDEKTYTWLTENRRPSSGRVADSIWDPDDGQLFFSADGPDVHSDFLGCRLSSSREK